MAKSSDGSGDQNNDKVVDSSFKICVSFLFVRYLIPHCSVCHGCYPVHRQSETPAILGCHHKLSPCCQPLSVVKALGPKRTLCETLLSSVQSNVNLIMWLYWIFLFANCMHHMLFQYFENSTLHNEFFLLVVWFSPLHQKYKRHNSYAAVLKISSKTLSITCSSKTLSVISWKVALELNLWHLTTFFVTSGVYAAAHGTNIEWVIVKGVASYFHQNESATSEWMSFASSMAASLWWPRS